MEGDIAADLSAAKGTESEWSSGENGRYDGGYQSDETRPVDAGDEFHLVRRDCRKDLYICTDGRSGLTL